MGNIYSVEVKERGVDNIPFEELINLIGWVQPSEDEEGMWEVNTADDGVFFCSSQETAHIFANTEEIKAMLMEKI